jgi:hypothetical protein
MGSPSLNSEIRTRAPSASPGIEFRATKRTALSPIGEYEKLGHRVYLLFRAVERTSIVRHLALQSRIRGYNRRARRRVPSALEYESLLRRCGFQSHLPARTLSGSHVFLHLLQHAEFNV